MYHEHFTNKPNINPAEVRFTKVLTKYSTEYIKLIVHPEFMPALGMDKKDLFGYFVELRNKYDDNQMLVQFENLEISKLDINRINRYLEKYIKENAPETEDKEIEIKEFADLEPEIEEECF
jgi:hypothetical protein